MQIEAINIHKAFGDNIVLNGFSHTFAHSKTTAIMGQSGCGKSTLLAILMGTLESDSGEIVAESFRKSAVFQEDRLCENLTAAANIRLVTGKKLSPEVLSREFAAVGLDGCENKPVRELSGGMKRRVALLRAMLAEYDVLFLDEPFKGLDEETKNDVITYVKRKTAGKTAILVTHDKMECEMLADETIQLK